LDSYSPIDFIPVKPLFILLAGQTNELLLPGILLVVLLAISFFISGSEVALFSLTSKDINVLKTKQHPAAKRVISLLEEPKEVYATLMITGTLVNISIIVVSNFLLDRFIPKDQIPFLLTVILKVIIIAFVIIFIGKILPKVRATQNNLRFATDYSFIIEAFHLLLRRVSKWLVSLADGIGKKLGADKSEAISIRELDEAIDIKPDEEASQEEKNIMKGIVKFGNISVKQIMHSRLDINGIEYDTPFRQLLQKVEELHYSRLPVYKSSLDEVAGIINTKDLIPHLDESENFDWHGLMRQPFFVPESKPIEDLLKDFQQKRIHFAVVVDEFGGTSGIVTLEDIMEEVIGEIKDEFDEEETPNKKIDENNYVFEGKTMLNDMCRTMKIPPDMFDAVKGESESLAGLVLELHGEIPAVNEIVHSRDFHFTVIEKDENRIQLVKVTMMPETNQTKTSK
jgi:gliding motility-associated protein GldE